MQSLALNGRKLMERTEIGADPVTFGGTHLLPLRKSLANFLLLFRWQLCPFAGMPQHVGLPARWH